MPRGVHAPPRLFYAWILPVEARVNVHPSTSFEFVAKFPTGLAAVLGVRIIDNVGGTTLARTTGFSEYPAGSGVYAITLTSPGTAGQYSLVVDDADGHWATDDLFVTSQDVETVVGDGNLYITVDDLRAILGTTGETYDDTAIVLACNSASRGIDAFKGTWYYPLTQTRKYSCRDRRDLTLPVDDIVTVTSILIDTDGDGVWETSLAADTDYLLEPVNASLDGVPYTQIVLRESSQYRWPRYQQAIKVAGNWGWSEAPAQVKTAAALLANRFLVRLRQAPLAVVIQAANEMVAMARLGSVDPDVVTMLEALPERRTSHRSLQLT